MKDFSYKLVKECGTISADEDSSIQTEVNIISFNGAIPKIDIRKWDRASNKMLKGIALTFDEAARLKDILDETLKGL